MVNSNNLMVNSDNTINSNLTDLTNLTDSKPKNRCHFCNKKVGLLGFKCKCDGNYCSSHRYNTDHNCAFDYKLAEKNKLIQSNPKIIAEKLTKI
jgi:predicted nucleic acid binding AN1-type Zn finger protein